MPPGRRASRAAARPLARRARARSGSAGPGARGAAARPRGGRRCARRRARRPRSRRGARGGRARPAGSSSREQRALVADQRAVERRAKAGSPPGSRRRCSAGSQASTPRYSATRSASLARGAASARETSPTSSSSVDAARRRRRRSVRAPAARAPRESFAAVRGAARARSAQAGPRDLRAPRCARRASPALPRCGRAGSGAARAPSRWAPTRTTGTPSCASTSPFTSDSCKVLRPAFLAQSPVRGENIPLAPRSARRYPATRPTPRRRRGSLRRAAPVAIALLACCASPLPARADDAGLAARLDAALGAPALRGARVSALVVAASDGRELYARSAERALVPASNQKILTALAALSAFGPAHRFRTELLADRALDASGALGTLYVVGGGDPGLDDRALVAPRRGSAGPRPAPGAGRRARRQPLRAHALASLLGRALEPRVSRARRGPRRQLRRLHGVGPGRRAERRAGERAPRSPRPRTSSS